MPWPFCFYAEITRVRHTYTTRVAHKEKSFNLTSRKLVLL